MLLVHTHSPIESFWIHNTVPNTYGSPTQCNLFLIFCRHRRSRHRQIRQAPHQAIQQIRQREHCPATVEAGLYITPIQKIPQLIRADRLQAYLYHTNPIKANGKIDRQKLHRSRVCQSPSNVVFL